jgi:hypothetical protein
VAVPVIVDREDHQSAIMVTKISFNNTNLQCNLPHHAHPLDPTRNSLTNSYVKNDVAMLGATFTVYRV